MKLLNADFSFCNHAKKLMHGLCLVIFSIPALMESNYDHDAGAFRPMPHQELYNQLNMEWMNFTQAMIEIFNHFCDK